MKSYKDKTLLLSLLVLGLFSGMTGRFFESLPFHSPTGGNMNAASALLTTEATPAPTQPIAVTPSVTLGFAGTIDLSKTIAKKIDSDYSKLFADANFLKTPDIAFAGLTDSSEDVAALSAIAESGVDVASIASTDRTALEKTIAGAQAAGIKTCGAGMTKTDAEAPAIFSKDGYTVGFLCFSDIATVAMEATDSQSGLLLVRDNEIDSTIKDAASKVNALIVSFDFGVAPGTLFTPRQAELATRAIDDGAAMIVGTHPHAAQKTSLYNSAPIFYSLGDFISSQKFEKDTNAIFAAATLSGKTVSDIISHDVVLDTNFVPHLAK